eukprot:5667390-Amphidinium_carterae.2
MTCMQQHGGPGADHWDPFEVEVTCCYASDTMFVKRDVRFVCCFEAFGCRVGCKSERAHSCPV